MLWAGKYRCFCFYYLGSLLSANTKERRGTRWGFTSSCVAWGRGDDTPLALQMCVFTPPVSLVQVRLVLAGCDSHTKLLWIVFRTLV